MDISTNAKFFYVTYGKGNYITVCVCVRVRVRMRVRVCVCVCV